MIHEPQVSMSPDQILRDAAQYLHRHGWTQGQFYTHPRYLHPHACALGAIGIVVNGEPIENPADDEGCQTAISVLLTYILSHYEGDFDTVEEWNDHPSCTVDEVIAVLTDAATEAESNSH